MKVLVTGASGFLGSHLVTALLKKGFSVRVLLRKQLENQNFEKCEVAIGDVLKLETLVEAMKGVDGVFHVAGAMSSSPKDRKRLFQVNVTGVKNIIEAVAISKCKLLHVSSVVAVGVNLTANDPLLNENSSNITKDMGYSNYDTKRLGEELVLSAIEHKRIEGVVVNPGLIYGAGDAKKSIRKGNIKAAKGKLPMYTSGGVNVVAVEDVTAAMIEAYLHGRNGARYLLTGDNITVKELLSTISTLAGATPPHKELPTKPAKFIAGLLDTLGVKSELCSENIFSATGFHWYDNSLAKKELGFKPKNYKEAIKSSVDWMKENHYI